MIQTKNTPQIPQMDSAEEMAEFWDTHDLTAFEDQLEEVSKQLFERETDAAMRLMSEKLEAVRTMAESKSGLDAD